MASASKQETVSTNGSGVSTIGFIGRRKMIAAISYLNHQINIIQEELDLVEAVCNSYTVCEELVLSIESKPDPLMPVTKGAAASDWDRWFKGSCRSTRRCKALRN